MKTRFKCNFCQNFFAQKKNLNRHLEENRCKADDLILINDCINKQKIKKCFNIRFKKHRYMIVDDITNYENNIKQRYFNFIDKFINATWRKNEMIQLIKKKFTDKPPMVLKDKLKKFYKELSNIKNDLLNLHKTDYTKMSSKIYHEWIITSANKIIPNKKFDFIFKKIRTPRLNMRIMNLMLFSLTDMRKTRVVTTLFNSTWS